MQVFAAWARVMAARSTTRKAARNSSPPFGLWMPWCCSMQDTPFELIKAIGPDVLVKGGDYTEDRIVGADVVKARGGEVRSLKLVEGYSTTLLVERIRKG
jgi:hypothetical protein